MPVDFFKEFFKYMSMLEWWQSFLILIVIIVPMIIGKFWGNIIRKIFELLNGEKSETLQYRMFWGLINDAVNILIKDEIRRSFKENGFHEIGGNEFSQYVKNQSKNLIGILKNHIINLYPPNSKEMKVSMDDILNYIEKKESEFEDFFFEIYIEAKKFKNQDIDHLEQIDKKFEDEINYFIQQKNHNGDCGSCLTVMFGKKLIAENKKSNIKTLKSQMTFAERKLTELHSCLISFYSEKINIK
jgi:hypothetical protein